MNIKTICRNDFQEYVALADINADLKRALKSHERVPAFVDNLAKELYHLPFDVSRETIKKLVYDMSDLFIKLLVRKADEGLMSDIAKTQIQKEADTIKKMDQLADDLISGGTEHVTENAQGTTYRQTIEI